MKRRIAIVASHPIQYHAHWYRELALSDELDAEVLYCHSATPVNQAESGFSVDFEWDVPLLGGYRYRFLENASRTPGVTGFGGTDSPELRDIFIRDRFDAVVVSGWHTKSYWQAIRACWECGTPVMVRSDSHLHDERPLTKKILKWFPYRYFITRLDACLPAGSWSRDYFLHYGARPERVFVVPHCVPPRSPQLRLPSDVQARRQELRSQWGIGEQSTAFLFAGKFIHRKRPFEFIRALAAVAGEGFPVQGLIAGNGPLRQEMLAVAESLRVSVTFTGFLNQSAIADAYVASDVLVLPSEQDTWGLVVNEAMTYGRPCIVSDRVGCGPDLIEPGRTGFVFPTGDVDALAACIRRFAGAPGLAAQMGVEAEGLIAGHSARAAADSLVRAVVATMERG